MVVILMMIVLSALGQASGNSLIYAIVKTLVAGGILFAITLITMKWILPGLSFFSQNPRKC